MKLHISVLFVLFVLSFVSKLNAQELSPSIRLQQAVDLFKQDRLDAAWEQLVGLETSQAKLLKSRILLKRGNIDEAYNRVLSIVTNPLPALREEAQYTLAVIQFWRRNYADVLRICSDLSNSSLTSMMRREAERLYDQTLSWISPLQASNMLANIHENVIRRDIIHAQIRKMEWVDALIFYEDHKTWMPASDSDLAANITQALSNAARHAAYSRTYVDRPPSAIIYTIGIVLPEFKQNSDFLPINRNLYAGIQSAIDTYNEQNINSKFELSLFRLNENLSNVDDVDRWAKSEQIDAVIGPLTSSQVRSVSNKLQDMHIPIFVPLANDPTLSSTSDKIYHINPGVEQRAEAFAEFAYSTMRYRSMAMVSDGSDIAKREHNAFKERFESLGGTVEYQFDPLDLRNPDRFGQQAMMLSNNPFLNDSLQSMPVDALVVSLGAGESEPLFNLVIKALDAVGSRVSIMGTQDLNIIRIASRVKRDYNVFTYSPYDENPFGTLVVEFDSKYRIFTSQAPDLYGYLGFDIATYITRLTNKSPNPSMWLQSIKKEPPYRGLAVPIAFDEQRVNRKVYFYKLTDSDKIKIEN